MNEPEEHKDNTSSEDIVVWAGVIARYNAIKNFADEGDPIRLATKEELEEYHKHKKL